MPACGCVVSFANKPDGEPSKMLINVIFLAIMSELGRSLSLPTTAAAEFPDRGYPAADFLSDSCGGPHNRLRHRDRTHCAAAVWRHVGRNDVAFGSIAAESGRTDCSTDARAWCPDGIGPAAARRWPGGGGTYGGATGSRAEPRRPGEGPPADR